MAALPGETAFLAALAARSEQVLSGLASLVLWGRRLPPAWGGALCLAGLLLLVAGARHRRVAGLVGGAALGALAALAFEPWLADKLDGASRLTLVAGGAAGLGVLAAAFPPVLVVAAGALPGAVMGVEIPVAGSHGAGLAIGAAVLGVAGLVGARTTAAVLLSLVGAALLGTGLASLPPLARAAEAAGSHPFLALAWLLVVGTAGTALQLRAAWPAPGAGAPRDDLSRPEGPSARSRGSRL